MFNRIRKEHFNQDEPVIPTPLGMAGFGAIPFPEEEDTEEKEIKGKGLLGLLEELYGQPSDKFVKNVFNQNFEDSCKIFNELFTYTEPEGKFKELELNCTASEVSPIKVAKNYVAAEFEDKTPQQKARQALELALLAANSPALMNNKKGIELFGENPETALFLFLAAEKMGFADKVLQGGYKVPDNIPPEGLEQMKALVENEYKNMSAIALGYLAEPEAPATDIEPDVPPAEEDIAPEAAPHIDTPPPSEAEETVDIGDYVQWTSNGIDQFEEPKRVEKFSDDGSYLWVEGSNTGIPANEVTKQEPPAAEVTPAAEAEPTEEKPAPLVLTDPVVPSTADREANAAVKKSTSPLGRVILEAMESEGGKLVTSEADIWRYWSDQDDDTKDALRAKSDDAERATRARVDAMLRPRAPQAEPYKPAPLVLKDAVVPPTKTLSPEFNEIVKDPRYRMAVDYAAEHGKISRDRLHDYVRSQGERIGSSTTTKIFNAMEQNGLLAEPTSKGRKYIGPDREEAPAEPRKAVQHVLRPRAE